MTFDLLGNRITAAWTSMLQACHANPNSPKLLNSMGSGKNTITRRPDTSSFAYVICFARVIARGIGDPTGDIVDYC